MSRVINSTIFPGLSSFFTKVTDASKVDLPNARETLTKQQRLIAVVPALAAEVGVGKFVALADVAQGTVIGGVAGDNFFFGAGGVGSLVDVVVVDGSGTVLQTLAAGVDTAAAGSEALLAQTATAVGVEITNTGILALKAVDIALPAGFTATLNIPVRSL